MKNRFFSLIFFCIIFLGKPAALTRAQGSVQPKFLTVKDHYVLHQSESPLVFSGITVEAKGFLEIEAGVEIRLQSKAEVNIYGTVQIIGNERQPIRFVPETDAWKSFTVHQEATSTLKNVVFSFMEGPILFLNKPTSLEDLTLLDGEQNILEIGQVGGAYENLTTKNITFINRLRGRAMREMGIKLQGSFKDLWIENTTFINDRDFSTLTSESIGISLNGHYNQLQAVATHLINNCQPLIKSSNTHYFFELTPDLSKCVSPIVPTIFIPGYGTSLNLQVLTSFTGSYETLDGWRFARKLTPEYFQFLADMQANKVPYLTAYYDWRLPSEQIVEKYLRPVISQAKAQYKARSVNLVVHSFGGIVARSYIQSENYEGDVQNLVELATPNQGAAKAYGVWEAGELPHDWEVLYHLLRFYLYKLNNDKLSDLQALHYFFPSAKELLPIYPSIYKQNLPLEPESLFHQNTVLLNLRQKVSQLFDRVRMTIIASQSEPTLNRIDVSEHPYPDRQLWPDGVPLIIQPPLEKVGDGTVPLQSVLLPGADSVVVDGNHSEIPGIAAKQVIAALYPGKKFIPGEPTGWLRDQVPDPIWFLFDCPIRVEITLPDGSKQNSDQTETEEQGEAFKSSDLLIMLLPRQVGNYSIKVEALADTPIRSWVDRGLVNYYYLKKGEFKTYDYKQPIDSKELPMESMVGIPQSMSFLPSLKIPQVEKSAQNLNLNKPLPLKNVLRPQVRRASGIPHQIQVVPKTNIKNLENLEMESKLPIKLFLIRLAGVIIIGLSFIFGRKLMLFAIRKCDKLRRYIK